jgi:hypothetical protein
MKFYVLVTTLTLCWTSALAQDAPNAEKEEGFKSLFDGKSFAGWQVKQNTPKSWKIEKGLLVLTGGRSHLFTTGEFDDFIVRFQWRPAKKGYNSGFFIRGTNQIQLAQGGAGQLFGAKGTKAVPKLHKPPGEWNEWEVSCIGSKVSLKVNGEPAWEIDDFKPVRGPLGIEAEGHYIEFRKFRIKKMSRAPSQSNSGETSSTGKRRASGSFLTFTGSAARV